MLDLKQRINCFTLELYEESETLKFDTIFNIVNCPGFYSCKWYYIKHDKDVFADTGEFKKVHYHLLVKLENAISIDNILNALDNERKNEAIVNALSIVKSFKGMLQYLIHKNDPDKFQYKIDDIQSNDKNMLYYFNDNTIIDNFRLIYSIVNDNKICSFRGLIKYCVDNNNIVAMQYIQDNAYLVSCLFRH